MVDSAIEHVKILEDLDYTNMLISLKSSDVKATIEAYRLMSKTVNYPLHLGITHSGTFLTGTIKSAMGLGGLLADGIGDTVRVSLTADSKEEIKVAKEILSGLDLRTFGIKYITCPTCGRTRINIIELSQKIQSALERINKPITVAIMGCAVNGPGEAKEADIGIAGGIGEALLFKKGEIICKIKEENIIETLVNEISKM
jgi:(E)-4-hydroxy-3-methylbut-2-enyl-diphosphate synthase